MARATVESTDPLPLHSVRRSPVWELQEDNSHTTPIFRPCTLYSRSKNG